MIASIVYQQWQFKVNTAVFIKTKICGERLIYAEKDHIWIKLTDVFNKSCYRNMAQHGYLHKIKKSCPDPPPLPPRPPLPHLHPHLPLLIFLLLLPASSSSSVPDTYLWIVKEGYIDVQKDKDCTCLNLPESLLSSPLPPPPPVPPPLPPVPRPPLELPPALVSRPDHW